MLYTYGVSDPYPIPTVIKIHPIPVNPDEPYPSAA